MMMLRRMKAGILPAIMLVAADHFAALLPAPRQHQPAGLLIKAERGDERSFPRRTALARQPAFFQRQRRGDDLHETIQFAGTSQRATITRIDTATQTVFVDRNVTWTLNQGLSTAYEGSAPDIGAFEVGSGAKPAPPGNLRVVQP